MKARCIVHRDVNRVDLDEIELPEPGPSELCIAARFTCISPGTELRGLSGKQGKFPYIPGYAMTGHVIAAGTQARTPVGQAVYVSGTRHTSGGLRLQYGGHISHAVADESGVVALPAGVDLLDACVAKLAAIANHGVELAPPREHETVAVVGLGVIGQLSARIYALRGASVVGFDRSSHRVAILAAAGVKAAVVERSLGDACGAFFPKGVDLVVDATGVPAVLPEAARLARVPDWHFDGDPRFGPRLVVQGSYPGDFSVPYQLAFERELTLFLPRDRQPRDLRSVLDLMARGELKARDLVTEVRSPTQAPETYADLARPTTELMTVAFDWTK